MSLLEKCRERGFWDKKHSRQVSLTVDLKDLIVLCDKGVLLKDDGKERFQIVLLRPVSHPREIKSEDLRVIQMPRKV
jgi:hypothetical protein